MSPLAQHIVCRSRSQLVEPRIRIAMTGYVKPDTDRLFYSLSHTQTHISRNYLPLGRLSQQMIQHSEGHMHAPESRLY